MNVPPPIKPELEFGNTANKRPVLRSITRRKFRRIIVVHVLTLMANRKGNQRRQESEKEIQQIETQRVGNEIESVSRNDSLHIESERKNENDPAV